jgi:hypothetical protein
MLTVLCRFGSDSPARSRAAPGALLGLVAALSAGCGAEASLEDLENSGSTPICVDLERLSCHADARCEARYETAAPCFDGMCYPVDFVECGEKPSEPVSCQPVSCSPRTCAFGRALDVNGCALCGCLPPTIPCEEMNEAQCKEAFECRGKYRGDNGDGFSPCPPGDADCDEDEVPTFVGCEAIPGDACQTHSDCSSGYCEPGSGTTPAACVTPKCSDGSVLSCVRDRPLCERGSVATIADGCWACVDEATCGKSMCNEPVGVDRTYTSRDVNECATFMGDCKGDTQPFSDECGCGCQVRSGGPMCPEANEGRTYASKDPEQCLIISYSCQDDWRAFSNDCGCGCIYAPAPPPPRIVVDCGQGTEATCDGLPPPCSAEKVLTVKDGCWACVTSEECQRGV